MTSESYTDGDGNEQILLFFEYFSNKNAYNIQFPIFRAAILEVVRSLLVEDYNQLRRLMNAMMLSVGANCKSGP